MPDKLLKSALFLGLLAVLSNQNPVNTNDKTLRIKRQLLFNDFDGGIFYGGNFVGGQNSEERQLKRNAASKPRRIKTDPDFDRRLAQLQQKFSFSPFLRAYAKYFVRNREQKRERRDINDNSYYQNRENAIYDDYYAEEEYKEPPRHHFHPIPVF